MENVTSTYKQRNFWVHRNGGIFNDNFINR